MSFINMKSIHRPAIWLLTTVGIAILFAGLIPTKASAIMVLGRLTNFDLYNRTGNGSVNQLFMFISGASCSDIQYYYGMYSGIRQMTCTDMGSGLIKVIFSGSGFPVPNGEKRHFGLDFGLNQNAKVEQIFWAKDDTMVPPCIDFAGMQWRGTTECPVRMVIRRPTLLGSTSVTISNAKWTVDTVYVPLDSMVDGNHLWNAVPIAWQNAVGLNSTLSYSTDSAFDLTSAIDQRLYRTILAQYTVAAGGLEVGRFYEQSTIPRGTPTLTEWGLVVLIALLILATVYVIRNRRKARNMA